MTEIIATSVYYIKLGPRGAWEAESLRDGILRFGYHRAPHDLCASGDWKGVRDIMMSIRNDAGAATRDVNQIRIFYETHEDCLFVTLVGGLLYWCQPSGEVEILPDGTRRRATVRGWQSTSIGGQLLSADRLSGGLLKVQMFQGTICEVQAKEYLLRKVNDQLSPESAAAEDAERALLSAIIAMMRLLTWQDFELLVDLLFSRSGWRRVSQVGRTQKTVDLALISPVTNERAFVQVKSHATISSLRDYESRFTQTTAYDRMFFVWHTGSIPDSGNREGISLLGPERLARMVLDAGLSTWLREKIT